MTIAIRKQFSDRAGPRVGPGTRVQVGLQHDEEEEDKPTTVAGSVVVVGMPVAPNGDDTGGIRGCTIGSGEEAAQRSSPPGLPESPPPAGPVTEGRKRPRSAILAEAGSSLLQQLVGRRGGADSKVNPHPTATMAAPGCGGASDGDDGGGYRQSDGSDSIEKLSDFRLRTPEVAELWTRIATGKRSRVSPSTPTGGQRKTASGSSLLATSENGGRSRQQGQHQQQDSVACESSSTTPAGGGWELSVNDAEFSGHRVEDRERIPSDADGAAATSSARVSDNSFEPPSAAAAAGTVAIGDDAVSPLPVGGAEAGWNESPRLAGYLAPPKRRETPRQLAWAAAQEDPLRPTNHAEAVMDARVELAALNGKNGAAVGQDGVLPYYTMRAAEGTAGSCGAAAADDVRRGHC